VFIPITIKHILVGRPSLAASGGGHGGPPHLGFLPDKADTKLRSYR